MTAGTPKALFVNLPPRLRASLTISASGDTMPYGVRTAVNLQEALTVLTQEDIFIVLIAVETAETVGDHLLREIRAGYPHIDIVVLPPEGDSSLASQIPDDLNITGVGSSRRFRSPVPTTGRTVTPAQPGLCRYVEEYSDQRPDPDVLSIHGNHFHPCFQR